MLMSTADTLEGTTVAAVTVAFNEETVIDLALKSVQNLVDEVVFVDNGSTDQTVEVAKTQLNSMDISHQVFRKPQLDLADLRHFAIGQTDCDWILILDADHAIIDTDVIKECIEEADGKLRYYCFKYLRLFGDFEHTYKDKASIGGLHPALIRNSDKIINAKNATRFNTPYFDRPIRTLWDYIPNHGIEWISELWKFVSEMAPGSKRRDLPHLPYHTRVNKDLVGVNMNGCKSPSRMLCRQDLPDLEKLGRNQDKTPTLKEFSMEKRGFESEEEFEEFAMKWFLEHLRDETDRLENQIEADKSDILPPVILDQIHGEQRYEIKYDNNGNIIGRLPDIPPNIGNPD